MSTYSPNKISLKDFQVPLKLRHQSIVQSQNTKYTALWELLWEVTIYINLWAPANNRDVSVEIWNCKAITVTQSHICDTLSVAPFGVVKIS